MAARARGADYVILNPGTAPHPGYLDLANVTVTTASAKGPIKIHALDVDVAEGTAAWLTARAQAAGGDGT